MGLFSNFRKRKGFSSDKPFATSGLRLDVEIGKFFRNEEIIEKVNSQKTRTYIDKRRKLKLSEEEILLSLNQLFQKKQKLLSEIEYIRYNNNTLQEKKIKYVSKLKKVWAAMKALKNAQKNVGYQGALEEVKSKFDAEISEIERETAEELSIFKKQIEANMTVRNIVIRQTSLTNSLIKQYREEKKKVIKETNDLLEQEKSEQEEISELNNLNKVA